MFIAIEIAPIVLIVVAILLLANITIPASAIVAIVAMITGSVVLTACIVGYLTYRLHRGSRQVPSYQEYAQTLEGEPYTFGAELPEAGPLPRTRAIQPPTEVHNHLHIEGMDPDLVAEYIRSIGRNNR